MSSLLTVDDYNSVNLNHINEYYEIDTKKISEQEFSNVLYDFCIVSHTFNGSEHTFTFGVHNKLWQGKCCFRKSDGSLIHRTSTNNNYNNGVITLITEEPSVKLYLYLCSFATSFSYSMADLVTLDDYSTIIFTKADEGKAVTIYDKYLSDNTTHIAGSVTLNSGVNYIAGTIKEYILCLLKKTDLIYNLDNGVTVGIVNHVRLNVDEDYLPNGDLVGEELLDIIVKYNDIEIPVYYDDNIGDYCFDLDLTEKLDSKPIILTVQVNENEVVNSSITEVSLTCNYPTANSFSELQSQIVAGAEIIQLTDTIFFENRLIIPHDIYIIGNDNTIELGKYHVIISDNVNVKFEGGKFLNGESCFIQKPDSILTLTGCNFVNAKITNNYKGSVVSSNNTSSITNITNCSFHNCHHTIYTGSELSVTNCKALYDDWNDSLDTDYSAFINAFDGIITVTGSICDIDYADKIIDNEEINYALSLIGLSNECTFNNVAANQLSDNDVLPFFGNFYNNRAHVFVPFYHDTVEDVVVASPILGKEDQSVCHRILGTDWVYKNNTQITRVDGANTIRKINWEDM